MSGYGVGREADAAGAVDEADAAGAVPGAGGGEGEGESWFDRGGPAAEAGDVGEMADAADVTDLADDSDERELVEDYVDSDPQQWISGLIADLERAEQGIGSGPRDALMARIKLAQAYSELGDTVQAAPLAVANVAQARRLFPSSEGMLRQLREFRDAACEAAGWTAAMMRETVEEEAEPSELVARPGAVAAESEAAVEAEPSDAVAKEELSESAVQPIDEAAPSESEVWAEQSAEAERIAEAAGQAIAQAWSKPAADTQPIAEPALAEAAIQPAAQQWSEPVAEPAPQPWPDAVAEAWPAVGGDDEETVLGGPVETESGGAVIHEFVRRETSWSGEEAGAAPAELAIPGPPEPEYAEEVAPGVGADFAAFEEIVRLRYELRAAHRTIDRLKHVNRKLREALDFEGE